ncbi:calcium-binding EF hand family protein [Wolffia australiana]
MERSFLLLILTVIALGFFLISYTPKTPHTHHHRRLKLRSNFSFSQSPNGRGRDHAAPFDPIIRDIEQRREDKEWEKAHFDFAHHDPAPGEESQPEWEDFMDAEDYINNEDRFNVTLRIISLFPSIDVNPADGFLSLDELVQWNMQQEAAETLHRSKREMVLHDKNRDEFLSFDEFSPPRWMLEQNSSRDEGWWSHQHFNASDIDGDGLLNLTEFNDFQHPSDSANPNVVLWLCKEEIRLRDKDGDGKLNFQEFFTGLFDSIRDPINHDDNSIHQNDGSNEPHAKKLFSDIDHDKDGLLSDEELKSVIGIIHPSQRYYAKQQAERALEEADANKDSRLSLQEMIDYPYAFYRAIFADDDDDDYDSHDELR